MHDENQQEDAIDLSYTAIRFLFMSLLQPLTHGVLQDSIGSLCSNQQVLVEVVRQQNC